ncbi:antitoxin Xre/MbcA/ParS toxin-binding domain-containing protein [Novosphingobium sp. PY1]|uniref:antitoxin Xre/MbcA/ParS toxin-binding domain-containing protein n=1 Tax=Novosphingobium sp. PY1 TaxID=1882221 RepID=UPI001A8F3A4A|nr:antitoxin Xre/MbcA/ParS toxin-binding domain-containing protein [Novosphingobium sp. PY1]GFM28737.1 uncharacterized protein PY1_contig-05-131 [Novosphingobium sp. PY1]
MTGQIKEPADCLVKNIAMRDGVPPGWREIYDRLIVGLFQSDCMELVTFAGAQGGELQIGLAPCEVATGPFAPLLAAARQAAAATCEDCGAEATRRELADAVRCLCARHYRVAQAEQAAAQRLFDGEMSAAGDWMAAFAVALGETPASRAALSAQGLEEVLTLIARIERGVYC